MKLLAGILALSTVAAAQDLPQEPRKTFLAESAAYTVSNVLDGWTTARNSQRGIWEASFPKGDSYLLGKYPSAARYAAVEGGMQLATEFAAYRLEKSRHKPLRLLGHALMIQGAAAHADGFYNDMTYRVKR
jgi:hypothetical protein